VTEELDFSHFDLTHYANFICEGVYVPYLADDRFNELHAAVPEHSPIKVWSYYFIYLMAKQSLNVRGDFFECGVFRGGSASFIARLMEGSGKTLHLFDTFAGMPKCDPMRDPVHEEGNFSDVAIDEVRALVGHEDFVSFHQGFIPETFDGMEDRDIAFAHVDVDIYSSVRECCEFIYPRLAPGGVIVFDDYGHVTCIGARQAVDEYFADKPSRPIPLYTGQAIVVKI
jgi:O-methyltransferase